MGASFSASLIGGAGGGQGSCSERPCAPKYHKHWSNRLFSGHSGLFNQDNSTVGRLTSADVEKAENAKRKDMKQHKQVVNITTILISVVAFAMLYVCVKLSCYVSAQWESQREEGACHTDRKAGELWRWVSFSHVTFAVSDQRKVTLMFIVLTTMIITAGLCRHCWIDRDYVLCGKLFSDNKHIGHITHWLGSQSLGLLICHIFVDCFILTNF